ncbi:hypothetical protein A7Q10_08350 [Methylacidiphilum caldifontis]|uniref:Uncharacterized protein n=1 Tax=Methylacidiphilum caldifontis TaxID=2795386 RepID=A0A4Y8PBJ1_9BACT|nr:hypothetical protein A7Q10_08350 [Methylacidiphilum caldifontis]
MTIHRKAFIFILFLFFQNCSYWIWANTEAESLIALTKKEKLNTKDIGKLIQIFSFYLQKKPEAIVKDTGLLSLGPTPHFTQTDIEKPTSEINYCYRAFGENKAIDQIFVAADFSKIWVGFERDQIDFDPKVFGKEFPFKEKDEENYLTLNLKLKEKNYPTVLVSLYSDEPNNPKKIYGINFEKTAK